MFAAKMRAGYDYPGRASFPPGPPRFPTRGTGRGHRLGPGRGARSLGADTPLRRPEVARLGPDPHTLLSTRCTWTNDQAPPFAVGVPASLSASTMARWLIP